MGASESKLEFKEDIFRLAGEDNIPLESSWWLRFIQLPETAEDVQALWSPTDLRNLTLNTIHDRPPLHQQIAPKKNAETLLYRMIGRLDALQSRRVFNDPQKPIAPEVLNGVRILTRFLPFIYEAEHLSEWEDTFFWQPRKPVSYPDPKSDGRIYYDGLSEKVILEDRKNTTLGAPLGKQLIDILINYLFFPGFTLPPKKDANGLPDLRPVYTVWNSGIGANKGVGMTKENERNAVEIIRLLLVLASRSMYFAPSVVAEKDIKPLTYLTTQSDRAVVLNTICSLLNTVLKYNQNPWTFPIDFSITAGDTKRPLVVSCLELLLILITYPVPNNGANEFRKATGRLHRAADFQFIVEALKQILMQPGSGLLRPVQRLAVPLPPIVPETLSLFWELLQCNKRFRSYLIDTDRVRDFVVMTLYYAIDAKDDPSRHGVVRICVFILQTLSVEEKFGQKLNASFVNAESLPAVLQIQGFRGSYADFLIGHIQTLLTSSHRGLESLHPALLAIISNIAPSLQGMQRATCSMLLNTFVSLSQPSFLLANETNHLLLSTLLEAMNGILEHQYQENRRFVEAVTSERKRFEALRDFTVEGALAEIDRANMERKDAGESISVSTRNNSVDSARSQTASRQPSLGDVPENSAFTIGEDEDDDEDAFTSERDALRSASSSSNAGEDVLPLQSRRMSEKARGKQPIGQGNFSRTTSRNNSNISLPSLASAHSHSQAFTPNYQWLNTWLPYLNLHTILSTIDDAESSPGRSKGEAAYAITATNDEGASKHTNSTGARAQTSDSGSTTANEVGTAQVKAQAFKWTNLSLGWYISLIWGRIYAADRTWLGTNVRLFNVVSQANKISLSSPKGAVDAAGDAIARRIGSISFNSSLTSREV